MAETSAMQSLGPARLMQLTEDCVTTFNADQLSLDAHADSFVQAQRIESADDETFLRQVLYGTMRYSKLLAAFCAAFYHKNSGTALRGDVHLYSIYAYLATLRLKELTWRQFRRLVVVKEEQKMMVFLGYMFDEKVLKEVLRDEWLKIYDKTYVDALIEDLLSFQPSAQQLLAQLQEKVLLSQQAAAAEAQKFSAGAMTRAVTKSKPFNLTQPKAKVQHIEQPLPPRTRSKPPPPVRKGPTREQRAIEAAVQRNRQAQQARLSDPKHQPFKLRVLERPSTTKKLVAQAEQQLAAELTLQPGKVHPVPPAPSAEVRLNAAAILREDALYKKKQREEAEMIKRYEAELRDTAPFDTWHSQHVAADAAAHAAAVQQRRDEMAAAQEAGVQARQQLVRENLEAGRKLKELAEQSKELLQQQLQTQLAANQAKRAQVIADKANVEAALHKLEAENRQRAEEIRKAEAEAQEQMAKAAAAEQAQKRDLILQLRAQEQVATAAAADEAQKRLVALQLRAAEKAPKQHVRDFDPTEPGSHRLLEEMSLVELRERLALVRRQQELEETRQREDIHKAKQDRDAMLAGKAANIARIRRIAHAQAAVRRHQAQERQAARAAQVQRKDAEQAVVLHDRLESKRAAAAAETARLAAEEKRIHFEQQQQAAGASQVEETKFKSLMAGARREVQDRQHGGQRLVAEYEATRDKANRVRMGAVKQEQQAQSGFIAAYDSKTKQLKQADCAARQQDLQRRRGLVGSQKDFEKTLHSKHEQQKYKPMRHPVTQTSRLLRSLSIGEDLSATVATQ